ncbi:hypothetical protein LCGC14_1083180 [marine sediment metagenome]|uniref:LTD domain-containing protein n=1 Tax=marine sediment metagenome TaxID=412755 RepID=A0A0F9N2A8_9ZZZZ
MELYNPLDSPVDISGWVFKDSNDTNEFVFLDNTIITPDGYLILCNDKVAFHTVFPDVENYIGDFGFNLSNAGELIRLYNSEGSLVDSLTYDNNPPWPEEADGSGATLSLRSPELDNALPGNWAQSEMHGTPGEKNEYIARKSQLPKTLFWVCFFCLHIQISYYTVN